MKIVGFKELLNYLFNKDALNHKNVIPQKNETKQIEELPFLNDINKILPLCHSINNLIVSNKNLFPVVDGVGQTHIKDQQIKYKLKKMQFDYQYDEFSNKIEIQCKDYKVLLDYWGLSGTSNGMLNIDIKTNKDNIIMSFAIRYSENKINSLSFKKENNLDDDFVKLFIVDNLTPEINYIATELFNNVSHKRMEEKIEEEEKLKIVSEDVEDTIRKIKAKI